MPSCKPKHNAIRITVGFAIFPPEMGGMARSLRIRIEPTTERGYRISDRAWQYWNDRSSAGFQTRRARLLAPARLRSGYGHLLIAILTMSRNADASPNTLCRTPMPLAVPR